MKVYKISVKDHDPAFASKWKDAKMFIKFAAHAGLEPKVEIIAGSKEVEKLFKK